MKQKKINIRGILMATIFTLITINTSTAQPRKGEFINANIGLGTSIPIDEVAISGSGFYLQAEYVYAPKTWLGIRPYSGFIFTSPVEEDIESGLSEFEVSTNAFFLGGKVRLSAPIPYAAPYIELGIGTAIGSFRTVTPFSNINKKGVVLDIPIGFGLVLGRNHNVELGFLYQVKPSLDQISGALAIGVSIPLH